MPKKGFKSITIHEEDYAYFKQEWLKLKEEYRKKGITSFSGYVTYRLHELIAEDEKHNR
jgi:hypothetical protein